MTISSSTSLCPLSWLFGVFCLCPFGRERMFHWVSCVFIIIDVWLFECLFDLRRGKRKELFGNDFNKWLWNVECRIWNMEWITFFFV